MSFALKGLEGPLKDKTFPLKNGMTLGRQGDVVISDNKASSQHARLQQLSSGQWMLEDNNSKNGTRVGGERIDAAPLVKGLVFFIGDQGFEIIEIVQERAAPAAAPAKPKAERYWYDVLAEFLGRNAEKFEDAKRPVSPLHPALVLDFVRGLQMNSRWTLGYGPRQLGSASLDLPIWEPGAPEICFEIQPSLQGILFKTNHPETVLLNGQPVDSQVLRVGDTIRIHETLIEVDFVE